MLRIEVLASGSSGNSVLVSSGSTSILIDAGIPGTHLAGRLRRAGVEPSSLGGIFVSHEHRDHIQGLRVFLKRRKVPLFMAEESFRASSDLREGPIERIEPLRGGEAVTVGPIALTPFPLPHDAACTYGFAMEAGGIKAALVTDLGQATSLVRERLRGCNCLLVEFNHDVDRLMASSYPMDLKMRVRGRLGHLSNEQGGALLREAVNGETTCVFLMHLSETNNLPELAELAAREALAESPKVAIRVARRHEPTEAWEG